MHYSLLVSNLTMKIGFKELTGSWRVFVAIWWSVWRKWLITKLWLNSCARSNILPQVRIRNKFNAEFLLLSLWKLMRCNPFFRKNVPFCCCFFKLSWDTVQTRITLLLYLSIRGILPFKYSGNAGQKLN